MGNFKKYDTAVKSFLKEEISIGSQDTTIKNYTKRLRYFRDFWAAECSEDTPLVDVVRSWRDSLIEKGLATSTIRQYMVELKAFFEYAFSEGYFESNPVCNKMLPRAKFAKAKPYDKMFDSDDLMKLWVNRRTSRTDRLWARNYAIIILLLDGKIRNAELLDLRLCDVHFADKNDPYNYVIINHGKGDKYREVDLSDISASALKIYLKSGIRPKNLSDEDFLFGTTAEHKFGGTSSGKESWHRGSSQWLSKLVEGHVKKVTGKSGFRSHAMRHNGANIELNDGTSIEAIQAELGHSSIQTTQIYTGKLQSKRHRVDTSKVFAKRDEWAERNAKMLQEGA